MAQRVTYRRRHCYATRSNKIKKVKTPGGRLVVHYREKKPAAPKCPISGRRLAGIPALRPAKYSNKRMSKRQKTVNRAYGGCLAHGVVRERIVRSFLLEERKIVKKVMKLQQSKEGRK